MSKYRKMNPKWKAKWLKALRSKEYRQGIEWLHDPGEETFCCLGVLQKIVDPNSSLAYKQFPDVEVCELTGLQDGSPEMKKLVSMNDLMGKNGKGRYFHRYTFAKIADWIEENL